MGSNASMPYNVDLVFCIDATASMTPLIDMVKKNAINFQMDLAAAMEAKKKQINQLRIRVIAFRDFLADQNDAIMATGFFTLPQDTDLFVRSVSSITAFGGGDDPEDGLEALAYAMRSKWTPRMSDTKNRQIIVVWTDAATHEIGYGSSASNYPVDKMPKTFGELSMWWPDSSQLPDALLDFSSSRLVLFAPDEPYWSTIFNNWENVVHFTAAAGSGLGEATYSEILDTIVNSVTSEVKQQ